MKLWLISSTSQCSVLNEKYSFSNAHSTLNSTQYSVNITLFEIQFRKSCYDMPSTFVRQCVDNWFQYYNFCCTCTHTRYLIGEYNYLSKTCHLCLYYINFIFILDVIVNHKLSTIKLNRNKFFITKLDVKCKRFVRCNVWNICLYKLISPWNRQVKKFYEAKMW